MSRRFLFIVGLLALLPWPQGLFLPAVAAQDDAWFEDVSQAAGVVGNRMGTEKTIGQAWGDYDNNGWLDLYVTDSDGPNTLYHNEGDGTFAISSLSPAVSLPEENSGGATFVDFNNDGWRDLYVLNWGRNVLFRNEGGENFVDVTDPAGVGGNHNSKTAAWGDYDQDGFVDLYVANWACYPLCGRPSTGESDRLYRNNGDGTFADVTNLLGGFTVGAGFVASFTDFDNDGDLDIYLVNDEFINPIGNMLWRNDGPGCEGWCFTEIAEEAGANTRLMGMGLATADYDNDGDQDFYFSNAGPMTLLQNQGDGTFEDRAQPAGVQLEAAIGWGAVFFDYDNDGRQDLYLALSEAQSGDNIANPLFHNKGDGSFSDVGAASGAADPGRTLGVAYGDYDRDGWLDLVVGNYDEGYKLYRNGGAARSDNNWLALELVGGGPVNRDAIGARVRLHTVNGGTQLQEVICGSSLGAGNALALHFGLGLAESASIEVIWADGLTQSFDEVVGGRLVRLSYPTDEAAEEAQLMALYGPRRFSPSLLLSLLLFIVMLVGAAVLVLVWVRRHRPAGVHQNGVTK